jgi:hypothetical protein
MVFTKIKRLKIGNKISCSIKGYAIYKRIFKIWNSIPYAYNPTDVETTNCATLEYRSSVAKPLWKISDKISVF